MADFAQQVLGNLQGLQNLQAQKMEMDQFAAQQEATGKAKEALQKYYASTQSGQPDYDSLNVAIMNDSRLADNVLQGIGIREQQQLQQAGADIAELVPLIGDRNQFLQKLATRANSIAERGGDPKDTIALAALYDQDPQAALRQLQSVGAALEAKGVKTGIFGAAREPMTEYQQAATNLRAQELELKKLDAKEKFIDRQMQRETNDLKKQELQQKLEETKQAKETKSREKSADLNQAYFGIDNMLNTVSRIEQSPKLDSVVGTVQGRMDAYVDDDAAATIRLIENLGSQAFMAMIPGLKGMGALSNAEGDKLAASLQNLSRVTSEKAFRETLNEVKRLMGKSRQFISERYGAPQTDPDVPSAQGQQQSGQTVDWSSLQ